MLLQAWGSALAGQARGLLDLRQQGQVDIDVNEQRMWRLRTRDKWMLMSVSRGCGD
jgi:hypothetical protein